jgi:Tol biopolymer transport system component
MSTRAEGFGDADLYVTRRESRGADWGAPQNLGPNVNSADREYWPTLSPDGHRLYFSIWRGGNFDLYVARRPDKRDDFGWEPAVPVAELNSSYDDVSLVFFEDDESGDLMGYFASSRATSPDDLVYDGNIWVTRLQEDGTFENPTLVPGLHTDDYSERLPTVRRDGLEVFFSRAVAGDMGAGKIFSASRESQADTWSEPAQVPYPVNYGEDRSDLAPRLSFDGTELYFASSRRNLFSRPFLDLNVAIRSKLKVR